MRDSLGGTVMFVIIIIFLVVALGYLAYSVNYTKAFRMNDKIISLYNEFNGECTSDIKPGYEQSCQEQIEKYANEIGYVAADLECNKFSNDATVLKYKNLFCAIPRVESNASEIEGDTKGKMHYQIITKINIQVPIISNIFHFEIGYIERNTKPIECTDKCKE